MYRHLVILSLFCLITISVNLSPAQAKRVALVIGNDKYIHLDKRAQLERAVNDAKAVGRALSDLGFEVIEGYNLGRAQMLLNVARLTDRIEKGDEVAFFYAGHGVAIKGQNYLIPADTEKVASGNKRILKAESIRVGDIIERFKSKGSRVNLLILDACRNNPFKNRTRSGRKRSIGGRVGLSKIDDPGEGTMIIFSAGEGQLALDSLTFTKDTHDNSVFTRSLVPLLKTKDLEIKDLANKIRKEVYLLAKKDNHKQVPATYNEIISDYYLAGRSIKVEPDAGVGAKPSIPVASFQKKPKKEVDEPLNVASLGTSNTEVSEDSQDIHSRETLIDETSEKFPSEKDIIKKPSVEKSSVEKDEIDEGAFDSNKETQIEEPVEKAPIAKAPVLKQDHVIKFFFKPLQNDYFKGEEVNFVVQASKPCYLTLVNIPETGETTVIFPNKYNQNNRIDASIKYEIPGSLIQNFRLRFSHAGIERVLAICNATRPDPTGIVHKFDKSPFTVVPKELLANIDKKQISRQIQVVADIEHSDNLARKEQMPELVKSHTGKDIEVRALVILEVSELH